MAKDLRELHELRVKSVHSARALVDVADAAKRPLTADEERQYSSFMEDEKRFAREIQQETELLEAERRMAAVALAGDAASTEKRDRTPAEELRSQAFRHMLMEGINDLSPDERRALTAGSDTQGGFIGTPQEFVKQLITRVKDLCFIRAKATTFSTASNEGIGAPTLDTDADDAEWTTEVKKITEDDIIRFGKRELKPHPLKKRILISDKQLRSEAMDSEAIVLDRVGYKFGITEEKAFQLGSGNQQPLGLFTASASGINTDRDVTTTYANDFTADDLKLVKYALKAQYMGKAEWLFHRDGVSKIARLKDGEGRYIFDMADKVGAMDTLLGRPINMSEYTPNTFTAGKYVGMFGDFSWYWICDSLSMRIKRLNELYAENSLVGFIFDKETDGAPALSEAFARIKTGTNNAP